LLHLEHAEHPDDPFTLFNLGSVYQELGRPAEALPLLRRSLERSHPSDSIVRKLYALIVQCHRQLGQHAEALAVCQQGRQHYPDDIELLFLEGLAWRERGNLTNAEACLIRLLQTPPGNHSRRADRAPERCRAGEGLACAQDLTGCPFAYGSRCVPSRPANASRSRRPTRSSPLKSMYARKCGSPRRRPNVLRKRPRSSRSTSRSPSLSPYSRKKASTRS